MAVFVFVTSVHNSSVNKQEASDLQQHAQFTNFLKLPQMSKNKKWETYFGATSWNDDTSC